MLMFIGEASATSDLGIAKEFQLAEEEGWNASSSTYLSSGATGISDDAELEGSGILNVTAEWSSYNSSIGSLSSTGTGVLFDPTDPGGSWAKRRKSGSSELVLEGKDPVQLHISVDLIIRNSFY